MRATFATWAKNHGYSDDAINLSLGHVIPGIRQNTSNRAYFHRVMLIDERREMMAYWEQHCLSRCGDAAASNIINFPASA